MSDKPLINQASPNQPNTTDKTESKQDVPRPDPPLSVILISGVIMGFIFGFVLGKGQVFQPQIIVEQMLFRKFIMIKMFLSAVACGFIVLAVLSKSSCYGTETKFGEVRKKKVAGTRGVLATIVGGLLLGIGMALCGACPGTVWIQLGTGIVPSAALTLAGCMTAAILWVFAKSWIESTRFFTIGSLPANKQHLDRLLGLPYFVVCLAFALFLGGGVVLLEYFIPYEQELSFLFEQFPAKGNLFTDIAWPPYVSGAIVGLLQLPALTLLTTTIGSSGAFTVIASLLLFPFRNSNSYIKTRINHRGNYFQPLYLLAAVGGGAVASVSSSSFYSNPGLSLGLSFSGGFVLMIGALLGGGCTSGHGLSGMQTLAIPSMLATAAMFAGGVASSFILFYAGAYGNSLNGW